MKISVTILALAAIASQAMAVVPIPVKGCQKTVVVKPTDTGCDQFAAANNITFKDLLHWNKKLRTDCLNLDVGAPLCVVGPKEPTKPTKPIKPTHPTKPTHIVGKRRL